ncbi:CdaR family transcriptional regulator [Nocardiopsis sp. MG754419]|uniref:PucR family transcriptional regulator n=1 Tax=Nocardiopsis sp. MG754419 TaxID=2259865 RepID=UPI001BA7762E|nr:PucR family transcriptional regulator [Nocardiopsis sp. MG754419]MBR8744136.1 PucR family transcriptional regulator [Nocardiopsis sp. MG754419]
MVLLDRLVTILGTYGTRLVGSPPEPGTVLRGVALHDPGTPGREDGDVLLAVGVDDPSRAVALARRSGAVAVVVRPSVPVEGPGGAEPYAEASVAAREHGVSLLVVDASVTWGQVAGVVYGLVLEGGETEAGRGPADLPALADTIADRVEGPVTIEDPRHRLLAYSHRQSDTDRARWDTILGRRVPDELQRHLERTGVTAHLASSAAPLYLPPRPELGLGGRTAVAVRVGREFLGSLWAVSEAPWDPERTALLAEGARTVALHMLRTRVSADLERQVESDLVSRLLEEAMDPTEAAGRLGLAATAHRVVALQAHTPDERHSATLMTFERATTGFGWSRPGRSAVFGSTVYTVLPCGADPAPARAWLHATTRGLPGHVTVNAGIGGPADLARLPASRREADESLVLHASRPEGGTRPVPAYDESWDEVLMHRLRRASLSGRRPVDGPVADLIAHDAENGTRYASTLRAWLGAQGDPNAAARELGVHPNTVRHRMRRMAEVTALDLDSPRARLALAITLEAHTE